MPALLSPLSPLGPVFDALEKKYPQYQSHFEMAHKAASHTSRAMDKAAPYVEQLSVYVGVARQQAAVYHLEDFAPMFLGLALCFFGGAFNMLIAVVEAVRLLCLEDLRTSFAVLKENYKAAAEQNRKDNAIDADGNGIPDVREIDKAKRFTRKLAVFMKAVDVDSVQDAAHTIFSAFLTVMATVRIRLARSLALGGSLANMAKEYVHLDVTLREVLPPEQKKWASVIANMVIGTMTMTLATMLTGFITTVHCSIRGADMFLEHAVRLAKERHLVQDTFELKDDNTRVLVGVVAAMGFLWQMSHGGSQPFPINLLLLPLTITESLLNMLVGGYIFSSP